MSNIRLIYGEAVNALSTLPDNSVDSIVCDPPYNIAFMGSGWDSFKTPVAFQAFCESWTRECLRVLKPGGYLLAFGGTRTIHRLVCAVEDVGFEIRDEIAELFNSDREALNFLGSLDSAQQDALVRLLQEEASPLGRIFWSYGQGFPKSRAIDKAIDAEGGAEMAHLQHRQSLAKEIRAKREAASVTRAELKAWFPQYSAVTANWERLDVGFRIPSEDAYNVLIEKLGIGDQWREMVRAEDLRRKTEGVKTNRVGDGSVLGLAHNGAEYEATTDRAKEWTGWGTALKPAYEPIVVARKPLVGTVAQNVLAFRTGAYNIDGCRVEHVTVGDGNLALNPHLRTHINGGNGGHIFATEEERRVVKPNDLGRFPANLVHDGSDEVRAAFPAAKGQQGDLKETGKDRKSKGRFGDMAPPVPHKARQDNDTSAARFFYAAKASPSERSLGLDRTLFPNGNNHPTVKPLALMRWLQRLVTPPGGLTLDCFCGSGTAAMAAAQEGFDFIGIEGDAQYLPMQAARTRAVAPDAEITLEKLMSSEIGDEGLSAGIDPHGHVDAGQSHSLGTQPDAEAAVHASQA